MMLTVVQICLISSVHSLHIKSPTHLSALRLSLTNLRTNNEVSSTEIKNILQKLENMPATSLAEELAHEAQLQMTVKQSVSSAQTPVPVYYAMKVTDDGFCFQSTSALYLIECVLKKAPVYLGKNMMPMYWSSVYAPGMGADCTGLGFGSCERDAFEIGSVSCMNAKGKKFVESCIIPGVEDTLPKTPPGNSRNATGGVVTNTGGHDGVDIAECRRLGDLYNSFATDNPMCVNAMSNFTGENNLFIPGTKGVIEM